MSGLNQKNDVHVAVLSLILRAAFALLAGSMNQAMALGVFYFPSDFDGTTQSAAEVSQQGNFAPICGSGSSPRLPGLDLVRGFAGVARCNAATGSDTLAQTADYIFLVDDTNALSPYLISQFESRNLLQTVDGRKEVRPSVIQFPAQADQPGIKILVVGEKEYREHRLTAENWLARINSRFASDAMIAGNTGNGAGREIFLQYHGGYYNSAMELISPSMEKILAFQQAKGSEVSAPTATAASSSASSGSSSSSSSGSPAATNAYIQQCRDNQVPIPPVWNPPSGNQWVNRGRLADPFASTTNPIVQVWTFTSTTPAGICVALPRMNGAGNINNNIQALGIICQSETTGKACFWDNKRRPVSSTPRRPATSGAADFFLGPDTQNLDPANMRDGFNLDENCTDCHRGSNVFVIRKGTPLEVSQFGLDSDPAVRYQPLSGTPADAAWQNPPSRLQAALDSAGQTQCTMCHSVDTDNNDSNEIAEPTSAYCSTIFANSIGTNMPPNDSANWRAGYLEEVQLIANACCAVGHANLMGLNCPSP